jgi:opine dehydrogenase
MKIGIAGTGGVALASAAWLLRSSHHQVALWSLSGRGTEALREAPLQTTGLFEAQLRVPVADSATVLAAQADVLLIAAPVTNHRAIADALVPHLRDGQTVIVSSMSSLSALYLFEAARRHGKDVTVASFGTTVFTARRDGPASVRVMTRRGTLGVSALPCTRLPEVLALCQALFGDGFTAQDNVLVSALSNVNPISHGPLALYNWTRIERAEPWPQYHYMTPRVSAVIERLDAERLALARAFGLKLHSLEEHFARSFNTTASGIAQIAAELHAKRGGPPGPTDMATRFVVEDVPYGLVFAAALARMAGVPCAATQTMIDSASLIAGRDFAGENELIEPLGLPRETIAGLLTRVNAQE